MSRRGGDRQRGAALIVVLLLVATLSFIALAISERTTFASMRSSGVKARNALLWRAVGAEVLAAAAIDAAIAAKKDRLADDNPLFAAPLSLPMEGGEATIEFIDRTRCFNLNSLAAGAESEAGASAAAELAGLFAAVDQPSTPVEALIAAVVDWTDENTFQEPRGAEDDYYLGLPTPYRTGAAPLGDVSELRAMAGLDAEQYRSARRWLCAHPGAAPSPINVNLLGAEDAPLLVGLMKGAISAAEGRQIVAARPPGGYESPDQFWQSEAFAGKEIGEGTRNRIALTSRFVEARATLRYYDAETDVSMIFEVSDKGAKLIARRIGPDE